MPEYIPSTRDWVREQVELYESSGGTEGTTLRDTGLPVIIVTNRGNKTGAIVVSMADAVDLEKVTERHRFLKECRVIIVADQ